MTIETRTTIELRDIQAVEMECATCHTKVVHSIEKFNQPMMVCYTCQPNKQLIVERSSDHREIVQLVQIINRLSALKDAPFIMRFDITDSSASREAI